jgi:mercuric ion transport protein
MESVTPSPPSRKWSAGALAGALVAAALASACCLGPLVLALAGLGGAGLLVKFERYRPLFAAVTLGLLALGFYLTYRRPKVAADCECDRPRGARAGKITLWLSSIVVVGVLFGGPLVAKLASGSPRAAATSAPASTRLVTINIAGMDCAACTTAIRIAIEKVDGVKAAKVGFEEKCAVVEYDPAKVTPQVLVDAVAKLGYPASLPTGQPRT